MVCDICFKILKPHERLFENFKNKKIKAFFPPLPSVSVSFFNDYCKDLCRIDN